jgi:hypothetical protein
VSHYYMYVHRRLPVGSYRLQATGYRLQVVVVSSKIFYILLFHG